MTTSPPARAAAAADAVAPSASIGRRVAAYAMDAVISGILALVAFLVGGLVVRAGVGNATSVAALAAAAVAVYGLVLTVLLVWGLVYTVLQATVGSPGQLLAGVRLVKATTGEPVGFGRALLRNIVWYLACSIVVGYFTPLFDAGPGRQGWHDRAGRAVVAPRSKVGTAAPAVVEAVPAPAPTRPPNPFLPAAGGLPDASPASFAPSATAAGTAPGPSRAAPAAAAVAPYTAPEHAAPVPPAPPLPPRTAPAPTAPAPSAAPALSAAPVPPVATTGLIASVPGITRPDADVSAPGVSAPIAPPVPEAPTVAAAAPVPGASVTVPPAPQDRGSDGPEDVDATRAGHPRALAQLVWDDGTRVGIYGRTLFGRNPTRAAEAVAVPVRDETLSLSKTHFEIEVDAVGLRVCDLHSTNGTVIFRAGARETLAPDVPAALHIGDRIECGDRAATVEAP